jgi:hypothetical protein
VNQISVANAMACAISVKLIFMFTPIFKSINLPKRQII